MSVRKTLLMLTVNYILIFAWIFFFRLEETSALIIFPITMGVAFFDTVMAEGRLSAYLWCGNLLIATVTGIVLQAYVIIRETGDRDGAFLRAAVEIPAAVLIIGVIAVISGHEAAKLKRRRQGRTPENLPSRDRGSYEGIRSNRGFRSSMTFPGDDYISDHDDPVDEEEILADLEEEPKFRVIKKS